MDEIIAGTIPSEPNLGVVVAMTGSGVIGDKRGIPWDLPEDRRLFRQLTMGGTVIMGRRTRESLPAPLADRENIVVSRTLCHTPGGHTVPTFSEALCLARQIGRPVFVIGGVELYRAALPLAATLHISWVEGAFAGDRYFPPLDLDQWLIISSREFAGFRHVTYRRA